MALVLAHTKQAQVTLDPIKGKGFGSSFTLDEFYRTGDHLMVADVLGQLLQEAREDETDVTWYELHEWWQQYKEVFEEYLIVKDDESIRHG